jgi:hypothetical protein
MAVSGQISECNGDVTPIDKLFLRISCAISDASHTISIMVGFRWLFFVTIAFNIVALGQEGGQPVQDSHRPLCTSAECRKVKSFVKNHYCGAPEGNGADDSCEIRQPKKRLNVKMTANYECKWVSGVRNCRQLKEPSLELRDILLGELRRLGLPAKTKGRTYFTVWHPTGLDWSLAEAYYDHIEGSDVTLCQVIAIIDLNSHVSVVRKVPLQKGDADKNTVTTWSPLDLADVNADGQIEVVLEGDAYEDHWIEVVGIKDGSFRTIYSGLGYYF